MTTTASTTTATTTNTTLVALGDSITFGYNLGQTNNLPSHKAFPYLVGASQGWAVADLGVPGWTSRNLLSALSTPRFQQALHSAKVVTVDIGSNDLLQAAGPLLTRAANPAGSSLTAADKQRFQAAAVQFATDLPAIVQAIRQQTAAPIVLVTLYDPFPDLTALHTVTEQMLSIANGVILQTAAQDRCLIANAYQSFNHQQLSLVRVQDVDIHPTVTGQQVLAQLVSAATSKPAWHQPGYYAVAAAGVVVRNKASATGTAVAWLHGQEGALVDGFQAGWLQVTMPDSLQGFVPMTSATLLLRPWATGTFARQRPVVDRARALARQGHAWPAFTWHHQTYVPVSAMTVGTGIHASWSNAQHELDLTTPGAAGLFGSEQAGGQGPAPVASSQTILRVLPSGQRAAVVLQTAGILVQIDGEPVELSSEPVLYNGQVYVPAAGLWEAFGGVVKQSAGGLQLLSPAGS